MSGMVMITRRRRMFAAGLVLIVLAALAERTWREAIKGVWQNEVAMEPIATPHVADKLEHDLMAAIYEKQRAQLAPPQASMPMAHRWVQTPPQQVEEFWHPSWSRTGAELMPMFSRNYARAA